MLKYIGMRLLIAIPVLLPLSIVSFLLIQLPPGDYLSIYIMNLKASGQRVSESEVARLTTLYALDKPPVVQYFRWITNIVLHGDFGRSFQWNKPVSEMIGERFALTAIISILTIIVVWIIAVPIGILSATRQYSVLTRRNAHGDDHPAGGPA